MDEIIEELRSAGCDIEGAMERVLDDKELYMKCVEMVLTDETFDELKNNIDANNVEAAFDSAHKLKGVIANMGLTPLFDAIVEIVEPLRKGSNEDLGDQFNTLIKERDKLRDIVGLK